MTSNGSYARSVREWVRSEDENAAGDPARPFELGARSYMCDADPGVFGAVAVLPIWRYRSL